jgi:hypothetical protein
MNCWLSTLKRKDLESQLSSYRQQLMQLEEEKKARSCFIASAHPAVVQLLKQHNQLKSEFLCMKTAMLNMLTEATKGVSYPYR